MGEIANPFVLCKHQLYTFSSNIEPKVVAKSLRMTHCVYLESVLIINNLAAFFLDCSSFRYFFFMYKILLLVGVFFITKSINKLHLHLKFAVVRSWYSWHWDWQRFSYQKSFRVVAVTTFIAPRGMTCRCVCVIAGIPVISHLMFTWNGAVDSVKPLRVGDHVFNCLRILIGSTRGNSW